MKTTSKTTLIILAFFTITSCALRPISSQYDYQKNKTENVDFENLGNGTILIYNGADGLHKIDNTARINMWIDGKKMGQVRAGEYAIFKLEKGTYEFKLIHVDLFKSRSTHIVSIDSTTKVIRIEPTITSNKLTITNQIPSKIDKYNYIEKR